jgi:serine/threonine-protein kinase
MDTVERLNRCLKDRYRIRREIGRGGMAVVYLADDLRHGRAVALKVLRPEFAVSLGSERFLREIEISARLQHPHILALYDSGEADGLLYFVMPFVEGESLRDRLEREERLPVAEAVQIAAEVANALAYAHQNGVVHRDVKPGNILLFNGHAVVADFGVARAISAAGGAGSTQAGVAIGTPAYMSPEQASGETDDVDGRADIYSLGCVLFELLAGRPPHARVDYRAVLARVVRGEAPRVRNHRQEVSPALDAIVSRALARDRNDRFESAAALEQALERMEPDREGPTSRRRMVLGFVGTAVVLVVAGVLWLRPAGGVAEVPGEAQVMAVLPFSTSGPDLAYLGEGMVDLLSTNLSGKGGVRTVDPRTVMHRWHERANEGRVDLDGALRIGRDANAGSVLLGSVVAAGPNVRLSAELYATDGSPLARAIVDGPADSVLPLVDSLSLSLMREIWRSREPVPEFRVAALTTGSLEAIQSYLVGERHYRRSEWDTAVGALRHAVALDSTFALAAFRLGLAYGWTLGFGADSTSKYAEAAARFADRLPPRERALLQGNRLFEAGRLAAVDSMREYVARYPDDTDGWFLLADAQYHAQTLLALPPPALLHPFDRLHELDPTLAPALIHPLEIAVVFDDSARFDTYLTEFRASSDSGQAEVYDVVAEVRWGGAPLSGQGARDLMLADPNAIGVLLGAALLTGGDIVDSLASAYADIVSELPQSDPHVGAFTQSRMLLLLATGRHAAAADLIDSLARVAPVSAVTYAALAATAGHPGWPGVGRRPEDLPDSVRNGPAAAYLGYWQAVLALAAGDVSEGRAAIARARADGLGEYREALLDAAEGWASVVEGDTAGGLTRLRSGLAEAGVGGFMQQMNAPLRLALARALIAQPATRDEGIGRLQYDWFLRTFSPYAMVTLGDALIARGDDAEAAPWYGMFLDMWDGADPSLAPVLRSVRDRLEPLVEERP